MSLRQRLAEALRANLNALLDKVREDNAERPPDDARANPSQVRAPDEVAQAYANLELPYGAELAAVKKQYRRLMGRYHPDRHHNDPGKARIANEVAAELTRAYDLIVVWLQRRRG